MDRKVKYISVRLTEPEKEQVRKTAKELGLTLSNYLRKKILND